MHGLIQAVEKKQRKPSVPHVRSGDTVRVSQKIVESGKTRTQAFEGMVIRTRRQNSLTNSITVRRVASGVGVEKTFMIHHPSIQKIEIVRRSKVRRNYLTYMRKRTGKSARLTAVNFDRDHANKPTQVQEDEPKAADVAPKDKSTSKTESSKPKDTTPTSKSETTNDDKPEDK